MLSQSQQLILERLRSAKRPKYSSNKNKILQIKREGMWQKRLKIIEPERDIMEDTFSKEENTQDEYGCL